MKRWAATYLRDLADRIDSSSGPRAFGGYWNFTRNGIVMTRTDGIVIQPPEPGCPLWYMAEDYDRAWIGTDD